MASLRVAEQRKPAAVGPRRSPATTARPRAAGRFLMVGDEKLLIKGVTYGPFRPDAEGCEYLDPQRVATDFSLMASRGVNCVRVYTVPPRWFLDLAHAHELRVMVGLPWEQHITFLDDAKMTADIIRRVRAGTRACAGHPALLAFAVGNEIPANIVRWYGRGPVEQFIRRLYLAVKAEDPDALVTYVNFPSTEYLHLPFLDFACFNVYIEKRDGFRAYLRRLHSLYHDRPLVLAELGLDSQRNGVEQQAITLAEQASDCFRSGCAGQFVFAWTDEWFRGGHEIDDWAFGLTDRQREPKPALQAVSDAYQQAPFGEDVDWPRVSVVVCTYNGAATIAQCCEGIKRLDYPDMEVIVVNDGSADNTAEIVDRYGFEVITVENGGLSRARNIGMNRATGQIIAYIDDDAWPDPDWLKYLAWEYLTTNHVAIGGPNIPPLDEGVVAHCVAHAPGSPTAVLMSDTLAEHIPGCNMSFRLEKLKAVGGFDPLYRIAGDDVDVCWKLQERGWTIGYHPGAMVWHRRRSAIKGYLRQQRNYGRAEAMLERKWPHKYNSFGHVSWGGQLYGSGAATGPNWRGRIYHGVWGSAAFQKTEHEPASFWRSLVYMPEWYLMTLILAAFAVWGLYWPPGLMVCPLLLLAVCAPLIEAWRCAGSITRIRPAAPAHVRLRLRLLTTYLHIAQPIVRLRGRLFSGLTPWRRWRYQRLAWPTRYRRELWSEVWRSPEDRLRELERALQRIGPRPLRGGPHARWDLELKGGMFGGIRLFMTIEEHGEGKQLIRIRSWPRATRGSLILTATFAIGCIFVGALNGLAMAIVLGTLATLVAVRTFRDSSVATGVYFDVLSESADQVLGASDLLLLTSSNKQ